MFGPRITTVFASRWKALAWSLGVLATAYCAIPDAVPDDAPGSRVDATAPILVAHHKSPWDK